MGIQVVLLEFYSQSIAVSLGDVQECFISVLNSQTQFHLQVSLCLLLI